MTDVATDQKEGQQQVVPQKESLIWIVEDDMTCAVCLDLYEEPMALKCAHNFCEKCIKLMVKSSTPGHCILCPLCRMETSVNPTSFEGLTKNQSLRSKVDNIQQTRKNNKREAPDSATTQQGTKILHVSVPRNIKLMEEYDAAIGKGKRTFIPEEHCGFIGYGLEEQREDNHELKYWHAMIIGPQESPIGQLIYNLLITVPDGYPKDAPELRFVSPRIRMRCVNKRGHINISLIDKVDMSLVDSSTGQLSETTGQTFAWNENLNIADILVSLRENMHLESVSNESADLPSTPYKESDEDDDNNNDNEEE